MFRPAAAPHGLLLLLPCRWARRLPAAARAGHPVQRTWALAPCGENRPVGRRRIAHCTAAAMMARIRGRRDLDPDGFLDDDADDGDGPSAAAVGRSVLGGRQIGTETARGRSRAQAKKRAARESRQTRDRKHDRRAGEMASSEGREMSQRAREAQERDESRIANNRLHARGIKALRVIDLDSKELGEMSVRTALETRERLQEEQKWYMNLDLVLVNPDSVPPVAKFVLEPKLDENGEPLVMDRAARERKRALKRNAPKKTKNITFRSNIAEGDVQTKCNSIYNFLSRGHPVVMRLDFARAPFDHELAELLLRNFIERIADVGWPTPPSQRGRATMITLAPLKRPKSNSEWDAYWEAFSVPKPKTEEELNEIPEKVSSVEDENENDDELLVDDESDESSSSEDDSEARRRHYRL